MLSDALRMSSDPANKMAIIGDRVELCCEATGVPPPDYYEWLVLINLWHQSKPLTYNIVL